MTVELMDSMGDDASVIRAARVSTKGSLVRDAIMEGETIGISAGDAGLLTFLMKNRHGTPFEHNSMTFYIEAPIFVWREFMRHRIGFSYNEESGRYKQLEPTFYVPSRERPLIQVGKPGAYTFEPGDIGQQLHTGTTLATAYMQSYVAYEGLLAAGIAKEVARMCLPVAIYSSAYVTCNARALMSFLSLRTKDPNSMFPSFPQREIEMVAEKMETIWAELMPVTHAAFHDAGRVSP